MSDDQAYGIAAGELRQFIEQFEQLDAERPTSPSGRKS